MKKIPFVGSGVAIVTPFDTNNKINYESLGQLIEMHIEHKTDAIVVCGTTGEASTMPSEEHLEVIKYTINRVNHRIPVIAGCGSNDTSHAVEMSKKAAEFGADALLSVTPYYNKANAQGLEEHFRKIAASVKIPVILYNVPSRTGVNISIEVLKKLSEIENIVAIKEASGNIGYAAQIAAEVPGLYIYSGNDDLILPIISLGGKGVISVAANILPEEIHNICISCLNENFLKARNVQFKIYDIINKLFSDVNPIPVKSVMEHMGYNVGKLRLPLGKMDDEKFEGLLEAIEKYGLKKLI